MHQRRRHRRSEAGGRPLTVVIVVALTVLSSQRAALPANVQEPRPVTLPREAPIELFFQAAARDEKTASAALQTLAAVWRDDYAALIVDVARLMRPAPRPGRVSEPEVPIVDDETGAAATQRQAEHPRVAIRPSSPSARVRERLTRFLERQTGKRFGDDLWAWRQWFWARPYRPHPDYAAFKGAVYGQIDPRMTQFFRSGRATVRLDEVDWGGVTVDGIPPLDHPRVVDEQEARYLDDGHVVFGVVVNGEARAYPKRILAWHELARDRLGGVEMTIVYCTLCGTVIPYESEVGGVGRTFGTSGLLYRSNKLMFDRESMSLWSTLEGRPVIGELAGADLQLRAHAVVTTTWGEWRRTHPSTTVLSLDTGHRRDYSEGAAYREYFATDDLMFRVSHTDRRLNNKAEVLVMRLRGEDGVGRPVAISAGFLTKHTLFSLDSGGRRFVVLTTPRGANRVYEARGVQFTDWNGRDAAQDAHGRWWRVTEEALLAPDGADAPSPRVAAQRAFWFAWVAQFPETALIK